MPEYIENPPSLSIVGTEPSRADKAAWYTGSGNRDSALAYANASFPRAGVEYFTTTLQARVRRWT